MTGLREGSFPGKCRLRKSNDFRRVFAHGRRRVTRYFVIYTLPNRLEVSRIGIQIRRKIGTAVTRNRLKRMVRELFRRMKGEFREPMDIILIAETGMPGLKRTDFEAAFRGALQGVTK
jgi:ribonuclease P protein component